MRVVPPAHSAAWSSPVSQTSLKSRGGLHIARMKPCFSTAFSTPKTCFNSFMFKPLAWRAFTKCCAVKTGDSVPEHIVPMVFNRCMTSSKSLASCCPILASKAQPNSCKLNGEKSFCPVHAAPLTSK